MEGELCAVIYFHNGSRLAGDLFLYISDLNEKKHPL